MKHIDVVVGVIEDTQRGVLIAKRHGDQHLAGLWEFPGGKIERGEAEIDALKRELQEELGITVSAAKSLCRVDYDYPEKSVSLHVFMVTSFTGEPAGLEGQEVRWVSRKELRDYEFPPANITILDHLLAS